MAAVKFIKASSIPASGKEGAIYYHEDSSTLKTFVNGQWLDYGNYFPRFTTFGIFTVEATVKGFIEVTVQGDFQWALTAGKEFFLRNWPFVVKGCNTWFFFRAIYPPDIPGERFKLLFEYEGEILGDLNPTQLIPLNQFNSCLTNEEILNYCNGNTK